MDLYRAQHAVLPTGTAPAAIAVEGGRIVAIHPFDVSTDGMDRVIDVAGTLAPGLVDTHVHVNEPGRTHWEGFDTATQAAAAGGVTTIVDMPLNSIPPTTSVEGFEAKKASARPQIRVDVGFWGGAVQNNAEHLPGLHHAGVLGFKAFLCESGVDEFKNVDEPALDRALKICAELGALLIVHAEHPGPLHDAEHHVHDYATTDHTSWLATRPREAEDRAIALLLEGVRKHRTRTHVVHLSSASALPLLQQAKREGLPLTAETCPHYLCLAHEDVPPGATQYKCAPPIRERSNQDKLWGALADGTLNMVVTDHSPAPADLKRLDSGAFPCAWGGIASVQLGGRSMWTHYSRRGGSFDDIIRWMALGPAELVGLSQKGRISVGADADFAEWDLEITETIDPTTLLHRHPLTPYAGSILRGKVQRTWLRGSLIYDNGHFPGPPSGALLKRTP